MSLLLIFILAGMMIPKPGTTAELLERAIAKPLQTQKGKDLPPGFMKGREAPQPGRRSIQAQTPTLKDARADFIKARSQFQALSIAAKKRKAGLKK